MIRYENECVGCPPEMGCMGAACRYRKVPHYYCDECDKEETLFKFEGEELCITCIKKRLEMVEGSDEW